jgi:Rrf2 family protein
MKLSATAAHAARALVHLARRPGGRAVPGRALAAVEAVSRGRLSHVLAPLVRAGIVRAAPESTGGYRLARAAKRITLLEVVEAIDGPLHGEVPRWADGAEGARLDGRLQQACDAAADAARARLGKVSLADLAGEG